MIDQVWLGGCGWAWSRSSGAAGQDAVFKKESPRCSVSAEGSKGRGQFETTPRRKMVCDNHLRHTSYRALHTSYPPVPPRRASQNPKGHIAMELDAARRPLRILRVSHARISAPPLMPTEGVLGTVTVLRSVHF